MRKLAALFFLLPLTVLPLFGQATASMTTAQIQSAVNSNSNATFTFAAGSYSPTATVSLPCNSGTLYTGPTVGLVTQANPPTAIMAASTSLSSGTTAAGFVFQVNSASGTNTGYVAGVSGCAVRFIKFSGTGGGIFVRYPTYGVLLDSDYFTNDNPSTPASQSPSEAGIWVDGNTSTFNAANGASYVQITNNVSYNNCTAINAAAGPTDEGGYCNQAMVSGWTNYLTVSNNTVNGTEQGFKLVERSSGSTTLANNFTFTNNNISNFSRIGLEAQQTTNGSALIEHNAVYQPVEPSNLTFNLSLPASTGCTSPCWTVLDNTLINGPTVYENNNPSATGAHYGYTLEMWGAGSIAQYNLMQGGNQSTQPCGYGKWCSNSVTAIGGSYTNATVTNNYYSGTDTWSGTANSMTNALNYEDGAAAGQSGLTITPNTVVQTSTTQQLAAPTISPATETTSTAPTVTISSNAPNNTATIFYTTDGSTPAIFAPGSSAGTTQVYTGPFVAPSANSVIKAIAQWGQGANQGIAFPQFGYVPSASTTATYTAGASSAVGASITGKTTITGKAVIN